MTERTPGGQAFTPTWPDFASLSVDRVRFTYDAATDTLFVDFFGEARPAASLALDRGDRDYLYVRVDPKTNAVVGLQIEHFLSYAVEHHPELAGAPDVATIVDIERVDPDRITHIRPGRMGRGETASLLENLRRLSA